MSSTYLPHLGSCRVRCDQKHQGQANTQQPGAVTTIRGGGLNPKGGTGGGSEPVNAVSNGNPLEEGLNPKGETTGSGKHLEDQSRRSCKQVRTILAMKVKVQAG